jgi:DNA replication and repair protein RecF
MYLKHLNIHDFKNYTSASLDFSSKINCFIGDNAAGKTNLLDAIYYLSFCKSYFNPIDTQNIRHGQEYFSILGEYIINEEKKDTVHCVQKRNQKKSFKLNKKEYNRLADHIGRYPLVMISPYDRDLINEGSDVRRRFIDSVISQFDPVYLDNLINYNKALSQRNTLLKAFADKNYFDRSLLEIYDRQLIEIGNQIFPVRKTFLDAYVPFFNQYFGLVSGGNENAGIVYESHLIEKDMEELLQLSLSKDKSLRYTTAGVHKDDLQFTIEGHPVKKFGSQGQQKSFIIALRLAQYVYIRELKGFKPLLLLDDIFDKLDDKRVEQLITLVVENNFGQVFITDTHQERIHHMLERISKAHRIYRITNGEAVELNTI